MSFYTYNLKHFVNLYTFSSLDANFRRTGAKLRLKNITKLSAPKIILVRNCNKNIDSGAIF